MKKNAKAKEKSGYINVRLSQLPTMSIWLCRCESKHLVQRTKFSFSLQIPSTDSKMANVEIKYTQLFINNEWHKAANGKTFPVINPSTGEEICQVEEGTRVSISWSVCYSKIHLLFISQADVDKAVEAARKAFDVDSPWRKLEPAARGNLMRKLAGLLRRDMSYLSVRSNSNLLY